MGISGVIFLLRKYERKVIYESSLKKALPAHILSSARSGTDCADGISFVRALENDRYMAYLSNNVAMLRACIYKKHVYK